MKVVVTVRGSMNSKTVVLGKSLGLELQEAEDPLGNVGGGFGPGDVAGAPCLSGLVRNLPLGGRCRMHVHWRALKLRRDGRLMAKTAGCAFVAKRHRGQAQAYATLIWINTPPGDL